MISRLLAQQSCAKENSSSFVERSLSVWARIATHLTPLVGETGFQALYARAVHLALPNCPGFTLYRQEKSTDGLFQGLKGDLIAMEDNIAEQCSHILLQKFIELVASMIGDVLMEQILYVTLQEQPVQAKSLER
jgi:hypothetical protein